MTMVDSNGISEPKAATGRIATRDQAYSLLLAWLFLLMGSFSFAYASEGGGSLSGQLSAANLVRYGCILAALGLLAQELRHPIRLSLNPLWLFVAYVLVCLLSTLWSVSPLGTFGKAVELAAATGTIVFATNRDDGGRTLMQLFNITFVVGICTLIAVAAGYFAGAPGFWIHSRGLIAHQMAASFVSSNGIGYISALTATVALNRALGSRRQRAPMFLLYAFSLMTAILAQGRAGLFAFLLGSLLVLAIRRQFRLLGVSVAVLIVLSISFAGTIETYLVRGAAMENIQSLSGRTVMWEAAWQSFLEHPLAGRGYGVAGRALFLTSLAGFGAPASSLHNGFLELLTGVGLLGFVPWAVSLIWLFTLAFRSAISGKNVEASAVMLPLLVITTMSIGAGGWLDTSFGYFLCSMAILCRAAAMELRVQGRQPHSRNPARA